MFLVAVLSSSVLGARDKQRERGQSPYICAVYTSSEERHTINKEMNTYIILYQAVRNAIMTVKQRKG